ncbi:MAG: DsbA family protein [Candidatus Caldarchaeum sp.]
MKTVVEFFHDVLCAWCYCLSPRMRRIVTKFPHVEVVHRCFALAPEHDSIEKIFGSKERGKQEILRHWRAANLNDDEHRINADLMASRDFDYPYSMPGLKACKAAEIQKGQEGHWDMFDRIQRAHLTECRNIADASVLIECATDVGLEVERFFNDFNDSRVEGMVREDLREAEKLGIYAVPSLVINRRYIIQGAVHMDILMLIFEQLAETGEIITPVPGVVSTLAGRGTWRII